MEIKHIAYRLGSRLVTNNELIEMIRMCSNDIHEGDLEKTIRQIEFYLEKSGAKTRYWLSDSEKPIHMARDSVLEAIDKAGWDKQDVDYLIHVGMFRGVMEPDQASFIAQAAEMCNVKTFDVVKACDSWVIGLYVAYNFLQSKAAHKIIIVNTECTVDNRPDCFCFKNFDEIQYKFPVITNCDAVTSTCLEVNSDKKWEFHFSSKNELADKCAIPLPGYEKFCLPSKYMAGKTDNRLYSYMKILNKFGKKETAALFKTSNINQNNIDYVITHCHSETEWYEVGEKVNLDLKKIINLYGDCGNMISASIPVSLAKGIQNNIIKRGNKLVFWTASSGMSFSVVKLVL
jgi:acyl-CoA:acyl-CoA alkyltransferase